MKHFFVIILLIAAIHGNSQNFKGGLFGGAVASQVYGDKLSGYDKAGFHVGGYVSNNFGSKDNGFRFEIQYITKGSRKNTNIKIGDYRFYLLRLNYIEMPFTFYMKSKMVKNLIYEAGLSYGVLVSAKEDPDGGGFYVPDYPPYRDWEFAGHAGIRYRFSEKWDFATKVSYSILKIRPYPGNQAYYFDRGQMNNVLTATLYYKFGKDE
ncbi:MAG: hypothetical protein A2W91_16175 [Bacteroidetes bacterium GWF2_38_335]|nr:MAG: hypothetical protein A2W91_16175 [Bacteroidetes bacterium GWF2_38_335]OFY81227.1 MAG: hypothetical protein A2281_07150 [Bacteroidetes bacterium RIFOXYA12_FULL_38_20]HBS85343.1 hypothetical protein [Bacteroidales bacterium]